MRDTGLQGVESVHAYSAAYPKAELLFGYDIYRVDFQKAAVRKQPRGNEDFVVQSDYESDGSDILKGELAEVNLSRLAIDKGDVILGNPSVLATETAHGDRLHATCAAVVTHHHPRHILQGVR